MSTSRLRKTQLNESEGYKELTYNLDGTLATVTLYESVSKALTIWTKAFTYSSGDLSSMTVTYPNGDTVSKVFGYSGGSLESVAS